MKTINILTTLAVFAGLGAQAGDAPNTNTTAIPQRSPMSRSWDDLEGKFGAGLVVGEPTGPTAKYWLNDTFAIDGTVGWSLQDDDSIFVNADVLWHDFDLIPATRGRSAVYFGVGPGIEFRRHDDNRFGARAPVGISYMLDNKPVDVFVEIAPILDVSPDLRGDFNAGMGIRFWF